MRMAEHDNVRDLEHLHGEFKRREYAVAGAVRRIGRHQVGDVAHHEQLARMGIEDHLRRDAGIATADDHDGGRLSALGELAKTVALDRHASGEKIAIAVDEADWERGSHGHGTILEHGARSEGQFRCQSAHRTHHGGLV
jgi:hypothetical protein